MKTFRELCDGKPSNAVQAMLDGLLAADKRKTFIIDMGTFGEVEGGICAGCAATCAIQRLARKNFPVTHIHGSNIKADWLQADRDDLFLFEHVINQLRLGNAISLKRYFVISKDIDVPRPPFQLYNATWRSEIPKIKEYIKTLKKLGL